LGVHPFRFPGQQLTSARVVYPALSYDDRLAQVVGVRLGQHAWQGAAYGTG